MACSRENFLFTFTWLHILRTSSLILHAQGHTFQHRHSVPHCLSTSYGRLKKSKVVVKGLNSGMLHLENTWFLEATHIVLHSKKEYSKSKHCFHLLMKKWGSTPCILSSRNSYLDHWTCQSMISTYESIMFHKCGTEENREILKCENTH